MRLGSSRSGDARAELFLNKVRGFKPTRPSYSHCNHRHTLCVVECFASMVESTLPVHAESQTKHFTFPHPPKLHLKLPHPHFRHHKLFPTSRRGRILFGCCLFWVLLGSFWGILGIWAFVPCLDVPLSSSLPNFDGHFESPSVRTVAPDVARRATNGVVRVLSANLFLRTWILREPDTFWEEDYRDARLDKFIELYLDQYDVILLQELWLVGGGDRVARLIDAATSRGFKYWRRGRCVPGQLFASGLFVLSRWPVLEDDDLTFEAEGKGADFTNAMGALYARIAVAGPNGATCSMHVFNTHLQSDPKHADVRFSQARQLQHWIASKAQGDGDAVLVAGDMNVDVTWHPDHPRLMDSLLPQDEREWWPLQNADRTCCGSILSSDTTSHDARYDFMLFRNASTATGMQVDSDHEPRVLRWDVGGSTQFGALSDHLPLEATFRCPSAHQL